MKKALIFTLTAILSLCLTACGPAEQIEPSPLPSEEIIEPSPAEETWTPPPVTPTPAPRTAEEVLPPVEKDIFEGRDDIVYAQSISAGPAGLTVILADGSLWVWGDNTNGALGDGTENYIAEPMKLMDNVVWADSEMNGIYALKANGELWGAGSLTGEADPSADMENPPTQEELRQRRLPHKILDGVLVK